MRNKKTKMKLTKEDKSYNDEMYKPCVRDTNNKVEYIKRLEDEFEALTTGLLEQLERL